MNYSNRYKSRPIKDRPTKPDNGDYDDMGRSKEASAYHYQNKRRIGRF